MKNINFDNFLIFLDIDGVLCPYDEFGNEISELTLEEYKLLLEKVKLDPK